MFILSTGEISRAMRGLFQSKSVKKAGEGLVAKDLSEIRKAGKHIKPTREDIFGPKVMYDDLERQMERKIS